MFEKLKSRVRGIRNATPESVTLSQLIDLLGLSGTNPKEMSEATYYACIRVLSESVGKLPLKVMKSADGGGTEPAVSHALYNVLRYRPNPFQSATAFWNSMEQAKHHDGNAIALKQGFGSNTTLQQLPWDKIEMVFDDKGIFTKSGQLWYLYRTDNGVIYKFHHEEIVHLRSTITTHNGLIGVPVRECLGSMIRGGAKSQEMLSKLYENGMTARAVLQYTGNLDSDREKLLVAKIQDYAEGKVDTARSIIPIPHTMSITPLNIKLTDAQFDEVRKHTALQIAAAFGIKPHQINDMEKSSYASAEAQQLAFYVDKLLVELKGNEEEITYKVFSEDDQKAGYSASFNARAALRTDYKAQMEALTSAVTNGIHTPNEARALMDYGPLPGGDQLIVNGNAIPLSMAGQQYKRGDVSE